MIDIEIAVLFAADHVAAEGTVIFKIEAEQHLVVDAAPVHVAIERQLYRVGVADGVGSRVGLAAQHAGHRVQRRGARLVVAVAVAAVGVGQ